MAESTQHKLDRVRPPRVQITYDVEVGDSIEMKELPFVVGIMADLSGDRDPEKAMKVLKERKFTEIDRDNFNDIMADITPRAAMRVENRLGGGEEAEDSSLSVALDFKNIEDFEPINIIKQVDPMRKLYEARTKLSDLMSKLDGNDDLEGMLQDILENTEVREEVKKNLGEAKKDEGGEEDAKPKK
ncbi:tssB1 [Symbiodinium sp. KB8]|nr:tssB1 [Symbiodinium sp. KB8]